MDSLITLIIIVVVGAILAWFKKLGQPSEENDSSMDRTETPPRANQPGQPRPVPRPPAQAKPTSWEEELRRLLEGESPASPPPARPAPVVTARPQQTIPTPPVMRPVPAAPIIRPILTPPSVYAEVAPQGLAPMEESRRAYGRASQLDKKMSEHIQQVPGQHVQVTSVIHRVASPEVIQVVSLFKSARTARQAVIASIILGPPKASEQSSALFD